MYFMQIRDSPKSNVSKEKKEETNSYLNEYNSSFENAKIKNVENKDKKELKNNNQFIVENDDTADEDDDDSESFKNYKDDKKKENDMKSLIKNSLSIESQNVINSNNGEINEIIEMLRKKGVSKDKAVELTKLQTITASMSKNK